MGLLPTVMTCTAAARNAVSSFEERHASGRACSDSTEPHLSLRLCDGSAARLSCQWTPLQAARAVSLTTVSRQSGSVASHSPQHRSSTAAMITNMASTGEARQLDWAVKALF